MLGSSLSLDDEGGIAYEDMMMVEIETDDMDDSDGIDDSDGRTNNKDDSDTQIINYGRIMKMLIEIDE